MQVLYAFMFTLIPSPCLIPVSSLHHRGRRWVKQTCLLPWKRVRSSTVNEVSHSFKRHVFPLCCIIMDLFFPPSTRVTVRELFFIILTNSFTKRFHHQLWKDLIELKQRDKWNTPRFSTECLPPLMPGIHSHPTGVRKSLTNVPQSVGRLWYFHP